jgi:vitamin B12 transporter
MQQRNPLALCVALALPALTPVALGQQTDSTPEELYVIGQRLEETTPQRLAQFGNRLEMFTGDELEIAGVNDLSQGLQFHVPGLYVAPKSGPFDYMNCSLQGSRCEDVLWLVDGVRTNNRLYNTTAPLDTIPAHAVERVEVLYGGQGIFYGTQAVSGVVNIVTKSFSNDPTGSFGLGLDEYSGTHLTGDYRFGTGDHQFAFYASKDESDGFQPFPDEDYQPSATDRERGYDVLSLGMKYAYDFTDDSRLTLLYQRTDNELDNLLPYRVAERNNARVEDWITAKWDYAAGDNVSLYVKAYWHDWDTEWDDVRNDLAGGQPTGTQTELFRDTFWGFEDYGITALAEIRSGGAVDFAVGYDYQRFWGNDEVWLITDKTETAQAVYAQVRSSDTFSDKSDVAFGVRYNTTSGNADATVWTLSGRHAFTDAFYVRGHVGTSFRLPDAEELYLRDCCEVGNPNLEPEESKNFEAAIGGSAQVAAGLSWELILFNREIDNLIDIDFDDPAFLDGIFANFDETVEFDGWELFASLGLTDAVKVTFDYTRNDAQLEGSSLQLQNVPETLTKLGLTFAAPSNRFDLSAAVVNVGDVAQNVSTLGRNDYGDYTVAELGAAFYLDMERRHRIGVRVENVFDEEYASGLGRGFRDADGSPYLFRYRGAPQSLHASYTYSF